MAEEKQRSDWWHTAALMAAVMNLFRKGRPVSAEDCHPMLRSSRDDAPREKAPITILRDVFCSPRQ